MDRNAVVRWILITAILLGGYYMFFGRKAGEHPQALPPETYVDAPGHASVEPGQAPAPPLPEDTCTIDGNRFQAQLTRRDAGMTHFFLTDARYTDSDSHDVSTTPDVERWRNLRTLFRDTGAPQSPDDQFKYDRFDWTLDRLAGSKGCKFSYEDDQVRVVKTVTAGERPFELNVETTLTNLADAPKKHATSIEVFAYRTNGQMSGRLGRVSPFQTGLECARAGDVTRKDRNADEFKSGWFSEPLDDRYAAIVNYYFAQTLVPLEAAPGATGDKPSCELQAEQWYGPGQKPDDEDAGNVFKARLAYPARALSHGQSATYRQVAFFGPKERDVLASAGGGWPKLDALINLGTFSFVAKFLVSLITWIHAHITFGNWGFAIIVMTILVRILLFPLTWKQIKSTVAMRKLKPEVDALNEKFKDDAQAKNLAMMELWRKHKVNPLGGCLPALVQMPIWFALYATLQTAVEFYHTSFAWFPDLSAPDQLFFGKIGILPFILGATMIVQQRIVPQQGMDPVQQKMMMWLLPVIFTVMMLFLPAALGVYMLTNSALGIAQQLAVEKFFPRVGAPPKGEIVVEKAAASVAAMRKGKARV